MLSLLALALVAGASTGAASAVGDPSRLRERPLQLPGFKQSLPVDPKGKHGPKRTAGYYSLPRTQAAEMFYFFFESRSDPKNDPLVVWMTGGPGCSSELAVFYENGPFKINKDLSLRESDYGWDKAHNMIFVDQPIGTGFSYSDSPDDAVYGEKGVAADMLGFMQDFYAAHPEFQSNDLFIVGESYAGHYVPAVAHALWEWNEKNATADTRVNIKGLAIGNGLTDPAVQYGAYGDFALQNGLIDKKVHDRIAAAYPTCKYGIEQCNGHDWAIACKAALAYCQAAVFGQVMLAAGNINVYDIRKECNFPLCYDFSRLDKYIAREDVREALGVGDRKWSVCDPTVHADMMGDWMIDYAGLMPPMLEGGLDVMIYAGDQDLICNYLGNRRWVDKLEWAGSDAWHGAHDFTWRVDGEAAAAIRQSGRLSFVKVFDAGHMVPMDQGKHALAMLEQWTRGKKFSGATRTSSAAGLPGVDEQLSSI